MKNFEKFSKNGKMSKTEEKAKSEKNKKGEKLLENYSQNWQKLKKMKK